MAKIRSTKHFNFASVLNNPSSVIPLLSDSETQTILIDSIKAYVDNEIEFETFVDLTNKMRFFSGMREQGDSETHKALMKLSDLSIFISNNNQKQNYISAVLLDSLNELSRKQ